MKLTKKHIGQRFDNKGADGSWSYTLVDVKGEKLLFFSSNGKWEVDSNKYGDWKLFNSFSKKDIKYGWMAGRVAE